MGRRASRLHFKDASIKLFGFTLVELLVVIAVIGVLASVLVVAINPLKQIQKARDVKRKANIAQIQQALELYRSDVGNYPDQLNNCGQGNHLIDGSVYYLRNIPCDPSGGGTNPYIYTPETGSPVTRYHITACLEIATDVERDQDTNRCSSPLVSFTRYSP